MSKEAEVERGSLSDIKQIVKLAKQESLGLVVVGGYAVRAYTNKTLRHTKDIDLAVSKKEDIQELKGILRKIGYSVNERPHGLSGYRKERGEAIVVNAIVEDVKSVRANIKSLYNEEILHNIPVASLEDTLIMKANLWRDRDIIDVCLIVLDSFNLMDINKLGKRLNIKNFHEGFLASLKKLLELQGTKRFRAVWQDLMGRKITKQEERTLWQRLSCLAKELS